MFKFFIVFGLFLSPLLGHATTPSEFYGQTMQEAQEWTDQMWSPNNEKPYVHTLDDFYMTYSYGSPDEMAEDFAEQLCQGKWRYYAEFVVHDYEVDGFSRIFKRNTLLEALFNNSTFINKLNVCLEAHGKSIESVVAMTIAATTLNKFIVSAGLGVGLSASIRKGLQSLFSKKADIIEKKSIKLSTRWKSKLNPRNLKNFTFKDFLKTIKTTSIVVGLPAAGGAAYGIFDTTMKDPGFRNTFSDPFPHPDSERGQCEKIKAQEEKDKEIYEDKLKNAEQVYLKHKQQIKDPAMLSQLEDEYQMAKEILKEQFDVMQAMLLEEQLRTGNYFTDCSTLSPFVQ